MTAMSLARNFLNQQFSGQFLKLGRLVLFLRDVLVQLFRGPYRWSLTVQQLYFIGNQSFFVILLTSLATGAAFSLQVGGIFAIFQAEGLIGAATGIAITTELAPLVGGFLLTGRVGAAMTAEIASMVVHEQVSALESMGVNPINYLVVPRVLAAVVIMPILCGLFMFFSILAVYMVGTSMFAVDAGSFVERLVSLVEMDHVYRGLRKMYFFAFIISFNACRHGLIAKKGAEGVGLATTQSVVQTLLALLVTDFILSYYEIRW